MLFAAKVLDRLNRVQWIGIVGIVQKMQNLFNRDQLHTTEEFPHDRLHDHQPAGK